MTISITCIDSLNYESTIDALNRTMACVAVDKVHWFSDIPFPAVCAVPVKWSLVENDNRAYLIKYNEIILRKIPAVLDTDFNIIIHNDGFAVNAAAWTDEFLQYDYIGAVWPWHIGHRVGNGGFSLRSKKLYDAIKTLNIPYRFEQFNQQQQSNSAWTTVDSNGALAIGEDTAICIIYREVLENDFDIKFAPDHIADQWSIEHNMQSPWLGKSFGFHGRFGIAAHYGIKL